MKNAVLLSLLVVFTIFGANRVTDRIGSSAEITSQAVASMSVDNCLCNLFIPSECDLSCVPQPQLLSLSNSFVGSADKLATIVVYRYAKGLTRPPDPYPPRAA